MEKYNKYIKFIIPAVAIVFFAGGFWYGSSSTKSQVPNLANIQGRQFNNPGQNTQSMMMRGGGMTQGEVLSMDDTGITVKGRDGGSKIIIISSGTKILKNVDANKADLKVGSNVTISGTANADGSISANSVSLRNDLNFASSTKQ